MSNVERLAGSMPIWYVVCRREQAYPFSQFGVAHIIACIPCDFEDIQAVWEQYVQSLPVNQGWHPEVHIYSRQPATFTRLVDEAQARDNAEMDVILRRASHAEVES